MLSYCQKFSNFAFLFRLISLFVDLILCQWRGKKAINRSKTKRTNNLIYVIMKHSKISRILIATCFCVVAGLNTISAQNGNPHSLTGEAKFNNVVLN